MISAVVPIFNEEESLPHFLPKLQAALEDLGRAYEIILIDDGSTDASLSISTRAIESNKHIRVFSFRKNQGKAESLTFGFQMARGDYVLTMDADLQDNPSEMKKFLQKDLEGVDIICGWRKDRKDASKMKLISRTFNYLLEKLYRIDIHDYNCGFKLYTREAAKSLRLYGGLHRFIPLIAFQHGFSVGEVVVDHDIRRYGRSKYSFSKLWRDLPDMFTMMFLIRYSKQPLHFFGSVGLTLFLVGTVMFGYLAVIWFLGESIGRRPLLNFSILLMLGGLQIFFTGFLAELFINSTQKDYTHPPLKFTSDRA